MDIKISLKQHIGSVSKAIVTEGDQVLRGELIAKAQKLGANIHASASGKVKKVSDNQIIIEALEEEKDNYQKIKEYDNYLETIKAAGIVGAGGAGFPTHVKLDTQLEDGYIIANCVECEPILNHNIELVEKNSKKVIRGIKYAMKISKATKAYIAIKSKNTKAISAIKKELTDTDNIKIQELRDIYPMGEERAIIKEIFNTWLNPDELPLSANSIVLNAETIFNISEAIEKRKPVIDKDITIAGKINNMQKRKVMLRVPIGTSIKSLINIQGGIDGEYGELIIGGPYTGKSAKLDEAVLSKVDGGAIVTIPFPKFNGPVGLLVCACGAGEKRLKNIAEKMGSKVVAVEKCKNAVEVNGNLKCETPGECPGQVEKIMKLKNKGAKRVIISNCSDCSNTVMCCAPKLDIPVYHHTDHVFRTVDYPLTRRLQIEA